MADALVSASGPPADPPFLDLILYPNPPLGRYGVLVVMLVASTIGIALGVGFASFGAWPVSGFLGLDLLLLWGALDHTRRQSRRAEIVRLDADGLVVRRLGPRGEQREETRLEPYWVSVVVDERRRHDPRLVLRSHGVTVPIGAFLAPDERRALAEELRAGLARYHARRATSP